MKDSFVFVSLTIAAVTVIGVWLYVSNFRGLNIGPRWNIGMDFYHPGDQGPTVIFLEWWFVALCCVVIFLAYRILAYLCAQIGS